MDSVIGHRGKSKNTLLVLTERKTRDEIIFKLPDKTAEAVVGALDALERKWGGMFKQVFKSIIVNNGANFRTAKSWSVLYWERGSGHSYIIATRIVAGNAKRMR